MIVAIAVAGLLLVGFNARSYAQPGPLSSAVEEAKTAIEEQDTEAAVMKLNEARQIAGQYEEGLIKTEKKLFDYASDSLRLARAAETLAKRASLANDSIQHWKQYVNWRVSLDDEPRRIIERSQNSNRISLAVLHMGEAFGLRGDVGEYSPRDLFTAYAPLHDYSSREMVNIWIRWLFRCDEWKPRQGSFELWRTRSEVECKKDWAQLYDHLGEIEAAQTGSKWVYQRRCQVAPLIGKQECPDF